MLLKTFIRKKEGLKDGSRVEIGQKPISPEIENLILRFKFYVLMI